MKNLSYLQNWAHPLYRAVIQEKDVQVHLLLEFLYFNLNQAFCLAGPSTQLIGLERFKKEVPSPFMEENLHTSEHNHL